MNWKLSSIFLCLAVSLLDLPWKSPMVSAYTCHEDCRALYTHYIRFQLSEAYVMKIYRSCLDRCRQFYIPETTQPAVRPTTRRVRWFYYPETTPTIPPMISSTTTTTTTTTTTPTTTSTTTTEPPRTRQQGQWPLPSVCGIVPATRRIVGGAPAQECEFPWMVYIRSIYSCGGTILDRRHILTAAHCFSDRYGSRAVITDVKVLIGSTDLSRMKTYGVEKMHIHPNHTYYINDYDVAILTLSEDIPIGPCAAPVCLADVDADPNNSQGCWSAGWGTTSFASMQGSRYLRKVKLPIVPLSLCQKAYGTAFVNQLKMCAGDFQHGGIDSCRGDSGGPLMCLANGVWVQHGIVSFGRGCAKPLLPGVYTRVSNPEIRQYILDSIQDIPG